MDPGSAHSGFFPIAPQRSLDNPTIDRTHQAVALCRRDKRRRQQNLAVIGHQAEQDFIADGGVAARERNNRLTVQPETPLLQGVTQPGGRQQLAVVLGGSPFSCR